MNAVLNETFPTEYSNPANPTLSPSGELSLDLFYEMVLVRESENWLEWRISGRAGRKYGKGSQKHVNLGDR